MRSDDHVRAAAEAGDVDPDEEMIRFVEGIRSAGRSVTPDFLVVAQNAPFLRRPEMPGRKAGSVTANLPASPPQPEARP